MTSKYIAAIEIGSSRIKGIVAGCEPGKPMKVLAIEDAPAGESVRYGRVKNAREANDIINDIIRRLENSPQVAPGKITAVYVADGGRSMQSMTSESALNFGSEEEFTDATVERLHKEAVFKLSTDRDIIGIIPRRYFVDSTEVKKIAGSFGSTVRGDFTILTLAPENHRAIERLFLDSDGREVKRHLVTRLLAQTDMALSESDRQAGTLFIDFGAETTTLAAFRSGGLVFAATLPIGSANITRDLSAALSVTFEKAENIKRTKGIAVADRAKFDAPDDEVKEIVDYVSARASEIFANINNLLVEADLRAADFPGGIVITGGGAKLQGFTEMVESLSKMKVRRAAVDGSVAIVPGINVADNFDIISVAKYAAAHSDGTCIAMPEKQPETVAEEAASEAAHSVPQSRYDNSRMGQGRRDIAEDDPGLLEDDKYDLFEQPVNVNISEDIEDLPPQAHDAETTRMNLLSRLKSIFGQAAEMFKPPVEREDDGMD